MELERALEGAAAGPEHGPREGLVDELAVAVRPALDGALEAPREVADLRVVAPAADAEQRELADDAVAADVAVGLVAVGDLPVARLELARAVGQGLRRPEADGVGEARRVVRQVDGGLAAYDYVACGRFKSVAAVAAADDLAVDGAAVFARTASRYCRMRPRDPPGRPRVRSDTRPGVEEGEERSSCTSCFFLPLCRTRRAGGAAASQHASKVQNEGRRKLVWVNSLQNIFSAKKSVD